MRYFLQVTKYISFFSFSSDILLETVLKNLGKLPGRGAPASHSPLNTLQNFYKFSVKL